VARIALKPKPKRLIRHFDPADKKPTPELSEDEIIASRFQEVIDQAQAIEDPRLRELWLDAVNTFVSTGDVKALLEITKWRRPVVDVEEFLFGEAYLGQKKSELFPSVIEAMHDLDTDSFDEAVLMGSLGCGKTTLANLSTIRDIYKVSCMRNPHATYGIQSGTQIGFTIQSVRLGTAKKVVFDELGRYIRNSPYFKTRFPYDPYVTTELKFKQFNMKVMPISSSTTGVISMNVLGGQLDEMNFMQKIEKSKSQHADEKGEFDQAKQMFNTLANRRKSRFINRGNLPGVLFVISSSRFPDDFTEQRATLSTMRGGNDPKIYVYHHSRWSASPGQFSEETFQVQIGTHTFPSRVLKESELPDPGCDTMEVPVDFKEDFERDTDGSLRDLGGATTMSTKPFITQRQYIAKAMDHAKEHGYNPIYGVEQIDLQQGIPNPILDNLRTDIIADRHCHIDLGISRDAAGVAIGHIAGYRVSKSKDEKGREDITILPVVAYDLILRVVQPRGGEIEIGSIRRLLLKLRDEFELPIKWVTFDGFQSVDSRQILRKKGFLSDYLSVEKPEAYYTLKSALYTERLLFPEHKFLAKELAGLEETAKNNKTKVDHRPNESKDVADAVCGVANFLLSRKASWVDMRDLGANEGLFLLTDNMIPQLKEDYGTPAAGDLSAAEKRANFKRRILLRRRIDRR
jgi:hypothetical protein